VISRTPWMTKWIEQVVGGGGLVVEEIPLETIFRAHRRGLIPTKRGKSAKARLAKFFGYRMRYQGPWRSHWNDYLMAAMVLFNYRWANSRRMAPLIFHLPRLLLQSYLVFLSLLKQF